MSIWSGPETPSAVGGVFTDRKEHSPSGAAISRPLHKALFVGLLSPNKARPPARNTMFKDRSVYSQLLSIQMLKNQHFWLEINQNQPSWALFLNMEDLWVENLIQGQVNKFQNE